MTLNRTYGINFPFRQSKTGDYLSKSVEVDEEIRSNLLHLIFTRKGSRYYLPDFGTRIYEFIFEPMDGQTFDSIKSDIRDSVEKYIPNLELNNITIEPYTENDKTTVNILNSEEEPNEYQMFDIYRTPGEGVNEYTAKIKIEYTIKDSTFSTRDFVIINI
jgi:phage baseplate assembly protein W